MRRFEQPDTIYDIDHLDNTDLAVILAGDICEGRVNPMDYLEYFPDYYTMTIVRFCLLLGCKLEELRGLNYEELTELMEKKMREEFPSDDISEPRVYRYALTLIQLPLAMWGIGCLEIEHCSIKIPEDLAALKAVLQEHFGFKRYAPFMSLSSRTFAIQLDYD